MDTKTSNSSGWENEFRSRKLLFEQATGNDKPKNAILPILRRRKEDDLPRSHITEFFDNLPLTSTSSTVSNDSQPTKLTSDETVVKHPPTTVEPLQIKVTSGAYECHEGASNSSIFCKPSVVKSHLCKLPYRVHYYKLHNPQHHQIPSPVTTSSSTISTTSPRSTATPQSTCTTTVTDVTEVKHAPIIKPRRMKKDYVLLQFKDNPQSTSNPVSTTVSSNLSQNITSRLTSDENIVEDKTDATQNKSTTKTIQENVPNFRNESENHAPIIKPRRMKKDYVLLRFKDNPQSTSNPVKHPAMPVCTTVSSNSSQNITSRLTSDENIVEGKTDFISEDSTEVHKKHDENHDMNKEYEDHNANEKYEHEEHIENEQYGLNKKQEVYVKHEQDVIQYVRRTKTIRNESENNFTKTIEDLQRNLRRRKQEIEEQKGISHETSVEMVKWKTLYDDLKCEHTSLIQQQKEKDLERENMMALIANLQQNLYEATTSLLVPSSKLELVKEKLNLLPTEFGRELQLIKESKEAIENVQRYAEAILSVGEEMDLSLNDQ